MDGSFSTHIEYIHGSKPFDCNQKEFCQLLSDIKNVKYHFVETSKGTASNGAGTSAKASGRRSNSQELSCDGSDDD